MELLKLLSASEVVAQVLSFLVFLTVMRIFLWKRFLAILDGRREAISAEYKMIEDAKEAILLTKDEYCKKLSGIELEAKALIIEATIEARKVAEGIKLKAEQDGERLVDTARANLRDEVEKAKEDLKQSVVDLTIAISEKVIQEKLTEQSDRKLVEDFIDGINKK